jgi:hypothetical protein
MESGQTPACDPRNFKANAESRPANAHGASAINASRDLWLPAAGHEQATRVEWLPGLDQTENF